MTPNVASCRDRGAALVASRRWRGDVPPATFERMHALLLLLAGAALGASPSAAHVRSTDVRLIDRIQEGRRRSPTLGTLVDVIEASDVFVYVEPARRIGGGYLQFVDATPHGRYVRVTVDVELDEPHLLAVIAHELRHAAEIAEAPAIVDGASLERFYAQFGTRRGRCGGNRAACYETAAAMQTTALVFREICGRSVPPDGMRTHW